MISVALRPVRRLAPALAPAFVLALGAGGALAAPAGEVAQNGQSQVTLFAYDFLSADELAMLRMVQSNDQALAIFVPDTKGFAAMAVSPEDGFLRGGHPVASAVALAGLPDAASAAREARRACDQSRKGEIPCVVVLTVEPR